MAEVVIRREARIALLEAWVAGAELRTWAHGEWDCLMAPCDWARALTGVDPAQPWRGRYDSAAGANAILTAAGGMARLVDRRLRALGWIRVREPRSGDFGVVTLADSGATRFGAVRYGGRWVIATADGMLTCMARARAAWTAPEHCHG
ncbi:MAG: hypothetical protein KF842_06740 [Caulobacter sp.]|nr:hypothetical protein [Caulobacter sp.]